MLVSDFLYQLPSELIAQSPLTERDTSGLMVLDRGKKSIEHCRFRSLIDYLQAGDLLVLNDTRVIPCRLLGKKPSGGKLEVFFLHPFNSDSPCDSAQPHEQDGLWEVLIGGRVREGGAFSLAEGRLKAKVIEKKEHGRAVCFFSGDMTVDKLLEGYGLVPLPPYINHSQSPTDQDKLHYQTIFAKHKGAVAAPTAGLHFTKSLMEQLEAKGVQIAFVTLHVGIGTFQPIKTESVEEHHLEPEFYHLWPETVRKIIETKKGGGRIIACGTTSTRVLESYQANPDFPLEGWVNLFIYPGFSFKVVDALITNFHLPKSSLLMLVCAFAGREFALDAYHLAVEHRYRFYSYGDAMLIL